jgi:hypothetical protein
MRLTLRCVRGTGVSQGGMACIVFGGPASRSAAPDYVVFGGPSSRSLTLLAPRSRQACAPGSESPTHTT